MNTFATRIAAVGITAVALGPLAGLGVAAHASDGDYRVQRTGSCSGSADWKLKAKQDDGRIEVEFEVDSNRNGQRWNVRLLRDGSLVWSGTRTTLAPSGSFDVERRISNSRGDDVIVGRAVHPATGQVCRGRVVFAR